MNRVGKTAYQRVLNLISLCIVIGNFLFLAIYWQRIPAEVPMHFDALGNADSWQSKGWILFSPIVSALIFISVTIIEQFPQIWNTGVKVTEKNAAYIYKQLGNLIVTVKFICVLLFSVVTITSAMATDLPNWFLGVEMLLLFGTIGLYMYRIFYKSKNVG